MEQRAMGKKRVPSVPPHTRKQHILMMMVVVVVAVCVWIQQVLYVCVCVLYGSSHITPLHPYFSSIKLYRSLSRIQEGGGKYYTIYLKCTTEILSSSFIDTKSGTVLVRFIGWNRWKMSWADWIIFIPFKPVLFKNLLFIFVRDKSQLLIGSWPPQLARLFVSTWNLVRGKKQNWNISFLFLFRFWGSMWTGEKITAGIPP